MHCGRIYVHGRPQDKTENNSDAYVCRQAMWKDKDREKVALVTEAFLIMKKFDIEGLKKAYGKGF
jgi:hypothetical protein